MIRLLTHPIPTPLPSAICLSFAVFLCVAGELTDMRGGRGVCGKPYLIYNHSILSGARKGPPGLVTGIWFIIPPYSVLQLASTLGLTHIAPHPPLYHVLFTWSCLNSYLVPRIQAEEKAIQRKKGSTFVFYVTKPVWWGKQLYSS